jgi:hypothetical protein
MFLDPFRWLGIFHPENRDRSLLRRIGVIAGSDAPSISFLDFLVGFIEIVYEIVVLGFGLGLGSGTVQQGSQWLSEP